MVSLKVIYRILTLLSIFTFSKETSDLKSQNQCSFHATINYTDAISCGQRPICSMMSQYRTYDGSCNNLKYGWWAMTGTPYKRLFENNYADGIHQYPKSEMNKDLPNCREISLDVYSTKQRDDTKWTLLFMQYGQLIAHDLTDANGAKETNTPIECCGEGQYTHKSKSDPRCAPIKIPKNDAVNAGRVCMDFYRSETTNDRDDCVKTHNIISEQINTLSGYMDASFVYGSDIKTAKSLREYKNGRLKSVTRNGMELLPQNPNAAQVCTLKKATDPCYIAGDVRVNQNPELAVLQNVYLLFHNNVANQLCCMNPQWDDETLFQEARRIVIGVHQNIAYYAVGPAFASSTTSTSKKLVYIGETGYVNDYNSNINAAVSNEFGAAAFRFFHTTIQGSLKKFSQIREDKGSIKLDDWFNNPVVIEQDNNFAGFTRGLATQPQNADDACIVPAVRDYLFKDSRNKGQDLKAKDCQRGRDHGLATYATAYDACCLGTIQSFKDFEKVMDKMVVKKLEKLYESPRDVDLEVGISLETIAPGTISGPVATCLVQEQFYRTRVGDRYFFENNQNGCPFTLDQLNAIRPITIASLLCLVPHIESMQINAFQKISANNTLVSCKEIPQLNLRPWKTTSKKGCVKNS